MKNKYGTLKILHLSCAVLFCAFTFLYLYFYQADVLTVVQHVLSGGSTHYNRTIGAVLLTVSLYFVHLLVYGITRLNRRMHALTYFPSLLILTVLTNVPQFYEDNLLLGSWTWIAPLLLVIYVVVIYLSKKIQPYEVTINDKGIFSQLMWVNVFVMVLMFFFVGLFSNHNDVFHYKAKMEVCLRNGDYDGALKAGKKSLATDSTLTMLRAYALAQKGELAEKLFEYPLVGGKDALLPDGKTVKPLMLSGPRISQFSKKKKVSSDYRLMGLLLDKDLNGFVRQYNSYRQVPDSVGHVSDSIAYVVPKHYQEALILYGEKYKKPIDGCDSVRLVDYEKFLQLKCKYGKQYPSKVRDLYGKTYWWYYFFQ